jgi:hypothetical protein
MLVFCNDGDEPSGSKICMEHPEQLNDCKLLGQIVLAYRHVAGWLNEALPEQWTVHTVRSKSLGRIFLKI